VIFTETDVAGVYLIDLEPIADERGFFARTWCERELAAHGLDTRIAQCNTSFNAKKGTLRGLHYQVAPFEEVKIVRCISGAIGDVVVDLRAGSPTYLRHAAITLTADNRRMLYIPTGVAHGFQTLADDTEVSYQMSEVYSPEHARGVRWDDPVFGISWPEAERIVNERDRSYPDYLPTPAQVG
jgi:dTDP-4-dehydrorhamnose 3,5-epimerase